ncbi:dienelactone hydrolase family protein [Paraburkholderia caballeronis]|uniref:Dienelactone hydrolase n=1 Tax=Paraburkholderia caballeronis TaxID=416943 RepID=A0A1H7TGS2_9BURK|nr:CocE/NonD family hydrolase [Paraburkholderia caballeronis]PXW18376.1 dienelactone hydrolase [Paraburkholderia caballeronis]PXW95656.1 dienelactone hydrolase [Paraburkholderia caballeronis]RAJ92002.1 dienelactone hydrolase [Paraburkholderia caballeronis]TDV25034.1 dienelactone hydrolase [Paraburkholderia caballeronis]SEB79154.1 Dienelactone hydrolase [Paraburkholderia caballeronis]
MAFRKLLSGWMTAGAICLLPAAHAAAASADSQQQASGAGPAAQRAAVSVADQSGPLGSARVPRLALDDAWLPTVRADMNEQIIRIPVDASGDVTLETTVYRPNGPGPFPMVVFNHGKMPGDPRNQERSDPMSFAREFVRHGYVVVAPNRRGFAESGGSYEQDGCDVTRNGLGQALDVAATVDYMSKQPYVDAQHIAVAGTSHGGLATMAYGTEAAHGVRALINFSGGLRQDACDGWQDNLSAAFGAYGEKGRVPSLWLYGDNDSVWSAALITRLFAAYRDAQPAQASSVPAKLVDFGSYKNDAHRLVGDRDGVQIWWPLVESFLAHEGMPTAVQYRVADPAAPRATDFASIDSVTAVPYLDQAGRDGYRNFLKQYPTRAFAVSDSGAWSWAEGGDNPMAVAISNCEKRSDDPCRLYAVNDKVVWNDQTATAQNGNSGNNDGGDDVRHSLASR